MLLLAFAPALACANIGHHLGPLDRESQRGKLVLGSPKKGLHRSITESTKTVDQACFALCPP